VRLLLVLNDPTVAPEQAEIDDEAEAPDEADDLFLESAPRR
jgi:hypothetical protein